MPSVRKQRALALCERAYGCDPLHTGAKRRLSGWAPEKWKERIAKEVRLRDLHITLLLFFVYQPRPWGEDQIFRLIRRGYPARKRMKTSSLHLRCSPLTPERVLSLIRF